MCLSRASVITQLVKNPPIMHETPVQSLGREDRLETGKATHSSLLGLPWWLSWERIHLQCGRPGFDFWVGKTPRRRERGYLLPYFGLENSMDCIVHGVSKSLTWVSDFHFHFLIHILISSHPPSTSPTKKSLSVICVCVCVWFSDLFARQSHLG